MTALTETFVMVLNMSITAACIAVGVLLARLVLHKMPRVFSYLLWSAVLLRLLCPVSFTSMFSFLGLLGQSAKISEPLAALSRSAVADLASSMQWAAPVARQPSPELAAWAAVWLSGCLLLLVCGAVSLLRLRLKLRTAVRLEHGVYLSERIAGPFVLGLLRPRVYLPASLPVEDRSMVIAHERVHIRRLDHLIKLASFAALCIHWFNPMAWASVLLMNRDMELSCDERVLDRIGSGYRRRYSLLLLEMAGERSPSELGIASFGEPNATRRIKNVIQYKRPTLAKIAISAAVVLAVTLGLLANPITSFAGSGIPVAKEDKSASPGISVAQPAPESLSEPSSASQLAEAAPSSAIQPEPELLPEAAPSSAIQPSSELLPVAGPEPEVLPEPEDLPEITFIWPVNGGYVSAGMYGYRGHTGMDIAAPGGTEIYAAQDGIVTYADSISTGANGKHVDMDHGSDWLTRYSHCSEVLVEVGDEVKQGQLIAKVGKTGNATGNQLHFEVRYDEKYIDPEIYIGKKAPEKKD